jgi:hypothetical protein
MRTRCLALVAASLVATSGLAAQATVAGSPGDVNAGDFAHRRFDRSATVDNRFFPLRPGTQLVVRGTASEDGVRLAHSLVFTVTDLTKVIGGIRAVVVWDRDYTAGRLVEAELSFFAQDDDGNVWHLGEYPEEYENGKFVKAPAWIAGVKGARAGIEMLASPRAGRPSYSQGYAPPPVNWTDRARVDATGLRTCVPVACYEDVLVIREYNADKPGEYQLKYYAPGVGNIRVGWGGPKDTDHEAVALASLRRLGPGGLARAREAALRLEQHAYQVSKAVYSGTQPARRS